MVLQTWLFRKRLNTLLLTQPLIYSFRVKGFTMSFSSLIWGTKPNRGAKISMRLAISLRSFPKKSCQEASIRASRDHMNEPLEMFNQSRKCLVWILILAH